MKLRSVLLVVSLLACAASSVYAQLPGAKLSFIFPPSGQVGTSLEVTIEGRDLNGAEELAFSHPGIKGEPVMVPGDEFIKRPQWQRNKFKVSIAADVPTGAYQGWFVGRYGISNPQTFIVGDLPQASEVGGNETHQKAKEIAMNSVTVGRTDAAKSDCFKMPLKAGQQVVLDCQAAKIGSRLDPVVSVFDPSGKRIARGYGGVAKDPVVAFGAPADGKYVIEVRDFLSTGGADRAFRLVASDRPYIESIFPPAVLPGTKSKHTLHGYNLPGGKQQAGIEIDLPKQDVEIGNGLRPRELSRAGASYRFQSSNPLRVPFATAPVVIEDAAAVVQKVSVPCEVAGYLAPAGDSDSFEFGGKKGETLILDAISHRAGHATDLQFRVLRVSTDAKGVRSEKKIAESDDSADNPGGRRAAVNSRDPFLKFVVPEDGDYIVRVVDQFRLDDPRASYRLAIRRPLPDFQLIAEIENPKIEGKKMENWSPSLLRGGLLKIGVRALRKDGFDGEIELAVKDLPAGIELVGGKIERGKSIGTMILVGGSEVTNWNGKLEVFGRAEMPDGSEMVRNAFGNTLVREVGDYDNETVISNLTEQLILASGDRPTPVNVQVEVPALIETSLGGTVEIPVKIVKEGAFKGAVKFLPTGIPNVAKRPELALDLNKATEGKLTIAVKPTKENKYAPGTFEFVVQGEAVLQHHPDPVAVVEATEDQKAVEQLGTQATEGLKQAQAKKAEIAKSALTVEEKAKQSAAADAAIAQAQERTKAVDGAKKRAADLLKQANDRNKPRDLRVIAFSKPVKLKIEAAPLQFKDTPGEIEVAIGSSVEIPVGFERLFGFADAVELSVEPPKDLKGFEPKGVSVPKDQSAGTLSLKAGAEVPAGEHSLNLLAKMTFNGVNCELRQVLKIKITVPSPTPEK